MYTSKKSREYFLMDNRQFRRWCYTRDPLDRKVSRPDRTRYARRAIRKSDREYIRDLYVYHADDSDYSRVQVKLLTRNKVRR